MSARSLGFVASVVVCAILSLPVFAVSSRPAAAGCVGAYLEHKEGQREVRRERREMRRALKNADSRREARREFREGMREIRREKRERRRAVRRELQPWC